MLKHGHLQTTWIVATLLAFGCTPASARIPISPQVKQTGKLAVANGLAYAPMEYVDAKGKPAGMNIELAQAVAKVLGAKLKIVKIPFSSSIPALVSGRVDIGWAGYTILPSRLKEVDFVRFLKAGTVIAVLPQNKAEFSKKNSLCGKRVAVVTGNAAVGVAKQLTKKCEAAGLPKLKEEIFPDLQNTIQAVLTGRADARLDDATSAGYFQAKTNGKNVVVGKPFDPAPLGVAVRKGDSATEKMLVAAFDTIIKNGTYAEILKRYGMQSAAVSSAKIFTKLSQLHH